MYQYTRNVHTRNVGYDGRLVHEASRAGVQVCEGIHDRNGILGWRRAKESAVSRAESKSTRCDKRNS